MTSLAKITTGRKITPLALPFPRLHPLLSRSYFFPPLNTTSHQNKILTLDFEKTNYDDAPSSTDITTLPEEITVMIAEHVRDPRDLFRFSATCKKLRNSCLRVLRSSLVVHIHDDTSPLRVPLGVEHVRHLRFHLGNHLGGSDRNELKEIYAKEALDIISRTTNLRSFRWRDDNFCMVDPDHCSHAQLYTTLIDKLKSIPTLKSLSLQFSSYYFQPRNGLNSRDMDHWPYLYPISLGGFKALEYLDLYHIYAPKSHGIEDLALTLAACPNLKHLGLGLDLEHFRCSQNVPMDIKFMEVRHKRETQHSLELLCNAFAALSQSPSPLKLTSLRLGFGIWPRFSITQPNQNYLSKMINLQTLQTIHIFNKPFGPRSIELRDELLNYTLFHECLNLRRLQAPVLSNKLVELFASDSTSVQELVFTQPLRMLYYHPELDRLSTEKITMFFGLSWRPTSNLSHFLPRDKEFPNLAQLGFYIPFPENEFSLTDFSSNLIKLTTYLPKLPKLEVIGIEDIKPHNAYRYIDFDFQGFARELYHRCRSLRFIKIGHFAWRVKIIEKENDSLVELEAMSGEDIADIELFCFAFGETDSEGCERMSLM